MVGRQRLPHSFFRQLRGTLHMTLVFFMQMLAGAVGGNVLGGASSRCDLGAFYNTIAGLAGGLIGGQALTLIEPAFDPRLEIAMSASMLAALIFACGLGGAAVLSIFSMVRRLVAADPVTK